MNLIKIFSFFSGAGFLDLGFEKSGGYEVVFVNELSPDFNNIYKYARKKMGLETPNLEYKICSIESLDSKELMQKVRELKKDSLVGFIGGPPCPDFSIAGKNKGKDGENGRLSQAYIDLICKINPHFFLFENVKGLYRTRKHREFFNALCEQLIQKGYLLTYSMLNAFEYGAPQDRDRLILFGIKGEIADNLNKRFEKGHLLDFSWELGKKHTREKILSCNWPVTEDFNENSKISPPKKILKKITVEYWWRHNGVASHPNQDMCFKPKEALPKFKSIKEGDVKRLSFKRLHRWRYSPTAAYGNNEVHLHPYLPRRISVAEALAIQSLPKDFEIPKKTPLSVAFKSIGNGVPYLLSLAIAKNILNYFNNGSKSRRLG